MVAVWWKRGTASFGQIWSAFGEACPAKVPTIDPSFLSPLNNIKFSQLFQLVKYFFVYFFGTYIFEIICYQEIHKRRWGALDSAGPSASIPPSSAPCLSLSCKSAARFSWAAPRCAYPQWSELTPHFQQSGLLLELLRTSPGKLILKPVLTQETN